MANAKKLAKRIYDGEIGVRSAAPMINDEIKKGGMSNKQARSFYSSVYSELRRLSSKGEGTSGGTAG